MAAQKAAGLMARGTVLAGREKGGKPIIGGVDQTPPIDKPITLDEVHSLFGGLLIWRCLKNVQRSRVELF
jgi:hypothetical protein